MTNISLTITNDELNIVKDKFGFYEVDSNNLHALKTYKVPNATITIYKTMVMVIQGNDCKKIYQDIFNKEYIEMDNKESTFEKSPRVNQNSIATMGTDEVGVGDFFGGIVVVAAYLRKDQIEWLKEIGVKDSKLLNDEKIINLYEQIKDEVKHEVINIFPSEYNNQYDKYKNSHIIKSVAHNQVLWNLSKNVTRPYFVIVDQFASPENYSHYLRKANKSEFTVDIFETKAESKYLSVACASIIARYHFLKQIEDLSNEIGIDLILGSSNDKIKNVAKQIITKFDVEKLDDICKKHFVTFKEVLEE